MIQFFLELCIIEFLSIIGLAVGEIGQMLKSAKNRRLDKVYELAMMLEIFKYQALGFMSCWCWRCFMLPWSLDQQKPTRMTRCIKGVKRQLFKSHLPAEPDQDSSDDTQMKHQMRVLEEIQNKVRRLNDAEEQEKKRSKNTTKN